MTTPAQIKSWETLADDERIARTVQALEANNFKAIVANSAAEAKQQVIDLLPEGAEVFTATSATLTESGIAQEINESGRYRSIRKEMMGLNRETQFIEMRKLASTPEIVVGSVHAVTEQGHAIIASFGGSQLPAYA